jgi:ribosomal protein L7/L12
LSDSPHILRDPDRKLHEARKQWQLYTEAEYGTEEERDAAASSASAYDDLDMHLKAGGALPADWDVSPEEPEEPAYVALARQLVREGKKIYAIKEVRTATGWGLRESKDFVDAL